MGKNAAAFAAQAGLVLDPWQSESLECAMGYRKAEAHELAMFPESADWRWNAPEVGLIVPRQNGKGSALEAMVLYCLFNVSDVRLILWSAHEFKTAQEAFLRIQSLVTNSPKLMKHVAHNGIKTGTGAESIVLHRAKKTDKCSCNGSRLRFIARSQTSGRGFTGDVIILDEAFELSDATLAALMFTLGARPNSQIWFTSSAPLLTSTVLRRVCKRGREGSDDGLVYREWCADDDDDPADPAAWAKSNPGLGLRLSESFTRRELNATDIDDFRRERLGIWSEDEFEMVIDLNIWRNLELEEGIDTEGATTAFAVDTTPDRKYSSIVSVCKLPDEAFAIDVIDMQPGTKWLSSRLVELTYSHDPCVIMIDSASPAKALKQDLKEAGFTEIDSDGADREEGKIVYIANVDVMTQACGSFYDAVMEPERVGMLRHTGDPDMETALEGAATRPVNDAWVWSRKNSIANISPLVAATLAYYGFRQYGEAEEELIPFVMWGDA